MRGRLLACLSSWARGISRQDASKHQTYADFVQVFYAPHIVTLSSTVGAKFQPIRYVLDGSSIVSNVFYSSSIAQVMSSVACCTAMTPRASHDLALQCARSD